MSKKHFQALATRLGNAAADNGFTENYADAGFKSALNAVLAACQSSNPMFDRGVFLNCVWDVAEGRRDAMGRKVKVSA